MVGVGSAASVIEAVLRSDLAGRWLLLLIAVPLIASLLWRRTHPLPVVVACFGTMAALGVADLASPGNAQTGLYSMSILLISLYAAARWASGRVVLIAAAVALPTAAICIAADYTGIGDAVGGILVLAVTVAVGLAVRFRHRARQRDFEQVRLVERAQLARDLHDTVAHHVSAIAIRAQAGLAVASSRPEAALEALRIIDAEAGRTLAEMRAMVGVLRREQHAELAPAPTIADLQRLAVNSAGSPVVEVSVDRSLDDVTPAIAAAVLRIVREAVTNAQRHARNATRIIVAATTIGPGTGEACVRLQISDDGDRVARHGPSEGYGVLGIIERATLLGGHATAGPAPGRGWVVDVELPLEKVGR